MKRDLGTYDYNITKKSHHLWANGELELILPGLVRSAIFKYALLNYDLCAKELTS
jgi:hypothetical protein